jgi:hypothetical protein
MSVALTERLDGSGRATLRLPSRGGLQAAPRQRAALPFRSRPGFPAGECRGGGRIGVAANAPGHAAAGGSCLTAPDRNLLTPGATSAGSHQAPAAAVRREFRKEEDQAWIRLRRQGGREWRLTRDRV